MQGGLNTPRRVLQICEALPHECKVIMFFGDRRAEMKALEMSMVAYEKWKMFAKNSVIALISGKTMTSRSKLNLFGDNPV